MRKALVLAGLAGLLALTACGKKDGDTAAADTGSGSGAGSVSDATTPATTPAAKPDEPADPVLGPDGFAAYKLGMSPADAKAAGLVVTDTSRSGDKVCPNSSSIQRPDGRFALVQYSEKLGLSVIEAKGDMHTPEGIKVDSTLAAVKKAYPKLTNPLGDPHNNGENFAPVPGNPKAKYRIFVVADEVSFLHLVLANNDCTI
jgi:hypothetical protein